jgi:hypothetical protein
LLRVVAGLLLRGQGLLLPAGLLLQHRLLLQHGLILGLLELLALPIVDLGSPGTPTTLGVRCRKCRTGDEKDCRQFLPTT